MKLAELEIGKNYGAVDEPTRGRYSGVIPRQVRLLEIVAVPEEYWSGGGFTAERATRNVRKCKVLLLDDQQQPKKGTFDFREPVATAKKDDELLIEARRLVGLWKDLSPDVHARARKEQKRAETKASIEQRLATAGLQREKDDCWVTVDNADYPQVRVSGKTVWKLLDLLGAA